MKKRCLGCGKVFDDKVSICKYCLETIENVRSQYDVFPNDLQKKNQLTNRKIMFCFSVLLIINAVILFYLSRPFLYLTFARPVYKQVLEIVYRYVLVIFLFFSGLNTGRIINKYFIVKLIKKWIDKDWYSVSDLSWRNIKYLISAELPIIFIAMIILIIFLGIKSAVVFRLNLFESSQKIMFYTVSAIGIHGFVLGFAIGFMFFFWLNTDWIARLNK